MTCRSFVRRRDPEQDRFVKRHGKEIDPHGKLCRYWANQDISPDSGQTPNHAPLLIDGNRGFSLFSQDLQKFLRHRRERSARIIDDK
jgi:hypothetical protein